ncbi:MAG: MoaD/ThiS family protein [Candidatus Aenigmarchaeota archaeon]|nr:MoaD/ThiS family protein [Candidatus Aenigmarchaeota archaeon]
MQVKVKIQEKIEKVEFNGETTEDLLKKMNINTESVLIKRNGKFVPVEDKIKNMDEIEVINIVSSG